MSRRFQSAVSVSICGCLICVPPAAPAFPSKIGVVVTSGRVQVDGVDVPGTTAIFSGNLVSSGDVDSMLQFQDGTGAVLKPGGAVIVYGDRSDLKRGITVQNGVGKHLVLANGFTISSKDPSAVAIVAVKDDSYFEVKAQKGESEVSDALGATLARIEAGSVLSFSIGQAPANAPQTNNVCGNLDENLQLTDALTMVPYQLRGANLAQYVGSSIRVTGTVTGPNSDTELQVLIVSSIARLNHPCKKGEGAEPEATSASANRRLLIVAIAIGGTLLGLGLSGSFGGPVVNPVTPAAP